MSATYIRTPDASLTLSEMQIMGWICKTGCDGGLTGASTHLDINRRQVQRAMARMLLLGLVERDHTPSQNRAAIYTLTASGKAARLAAMAALFGDLTSGG